MSEQAGGSMRDIDVREASRVIKDHAAKQQMRVELTDDQLNAIMEQWGKGNPEQPAEITFYVGGRPVGQLKVATCAYWSDTCCA